MVGGEGGAVDPLVMFMYSCVCMFEKTMKHKTQRDNANIQSNWLCACVWVLSSRESWRKRNERENEQLETETRKTRIFFE